MSMRAVVAMPTHEDPLPAPDAPPKGFFAKVFRMRPRPRFRGVYVHSGGPPSELGPILYSTVRARGVEQAWKELITDNAAGWSSLHFLADEERARSWDGTTKVGLDVHMENVSAERPDPGPVTYAGDPLRDLGFTEPPLADFTDKMGAVSVWVLCRGEAVLFVVEDDGFGVREVGRYAWSTEPDWDDVDGAFDSASEWN